METIFRSNILEAISNRKCINLNKKCCQETKKHHINFQTKCVCNCFLWPFFCLRLLYFYFNYCLLNSIRLNIQQSWKCIPLVFHQLQNAGFISESASSNILIWLDDDSILRSNIKENRACNFIETYTLIKVMVSNDF